MPWRTLIVPKVRMSGWIRRRLLSRPVMAPLAAPRPRARRSAGAVIASWPAATSQTSTTIRPVSWPTDRSIRPQRITKVWPRARTASAADWAQSAALAVLALGQTFVILCGLIDLSVGQLTGLIVVLVCDVAAGQDAMTAPALLLALGLGAASGAITGLLNNRLRIHPLILTFGTMSVLQGIVFTYTDRSVGRAPAAIAWLADGRLLGLPVAPLLVLLLAAGAHVTLTRTRFGMHVHAVGGGRDNARRAGIDTDRVAATVFVISGVSASIGGLLVAGRLGVGYPHAGAGFERS